MDENEKRAMEAQMEIFGALPTFGLVGDPRLAALKEENKRLREALEPWAFLDCPDVQMIFTLSLIHI